MLVSNPVRGTIRPDARFYPTHPQAFDRPAGNHEPLVTQDFGPTTVDVEPTMEWPGGEANIFGTPIAAKTYKNFHAALDISKASCDANVLAAAAGTVTTSKLNVSGAAIIVINHGKVGGHRFETGYVHMSERLVQVGATVQVGDIIGKIGDTGLLSTGCHLHFFVTKDGDRVDPWRRLAQNTAIDPDAPAAGAPVVTPPVEAPDMPIPASDAEYLAGHIGVIGNTTEGARVRSGPKMDATLVRTIPAGTQEAWLPTCWVKGEATFGSDRWLTRWNSGQWEFTHEANVRSVTPLGPQL
jgi:murein DD-endopeptidase MepM/ murein hydrolase activator NlpD